MRNIQDALSIFLLHHLPLAWSIAPKAHVLFWASKGTKKVSAAFWTKASRSPQIAFQHLGFEFRSITDGAFETVGDIRIHHITPKLAYGFGAGIHDMPWKCLIMKNGNSGTFSPLM